MSTRIPITPEVLKWARESAGYELEQLASKQGFSKFPEWETGELSPTYPQLEKIAKQLNRPIAIFLFPSPPEEEPIEKSLRAMSQEDIKNLSPEIRKLFKQAKAYQYSLKELWEPEQEQQRKRIRWLTSIGSGSPEELATKARQILNVSIEEQLSWRNSDIALKHWRNVLADNGVYVFKEPFKNDVVAGFCVYDELYPIIFVNSSSSKNRQIFTVFHELAHLVYRESYLDIFDDRMWRLEILQPSHIEVTCNAFAGEFLVPEPSLLAFADATQSVNESTVNDLAERFHVSKYVILRRFHTLGMVDTNFYQKKVEEWESSFDLWGEQKQEKVSDTGGGDYYNNKMSYLGQSYLTLVFRNYAQGRISMEEAASHLNVKVKSFPTIEEKFLTRSEV